MGRTSSRSSPWETRVWTAPTRTSTAASIYGNIMEDREPDFDAVKDADHGRRGNPEIL